MTSTLDAPALIVAYPPVSVLNDGEWWKTTVLTNSARALNVADPINVAVDLKVTAPSASMAFMTVKANIVGVGVGVFASVATCAERLAILESSCENNKPFTLLKLVYSPCKPPSDRCFSTNGIKKSPSLKGLVVSNDFVSLLYVYASLLGIWKPAVKAI